MRQNNVRKPLNAATSGSRYGFTLIELLVVIAIIAILAAILFPVFAKVREKARQSSCSSNMKQIGLAVMQYTQDYDETFPVGWDNNGSVWGGTASQPVLSWPGRVAPYINSIAVFSCPDDGLVGPSATGGAGNYISYSGNSFHDPSSPKDSNGDYANTGVFAVLGESTPTNRYLQPTVTTLSQIGRPSEGIMISEKWASDENTYLKASGNTWCTQSSAFCPSVVEGTMWGIWPVASNVPDGGETGANVYPNGPNQAVSVHAGNVSNFVFCDGHVKAMQPVATDPNLWGQPQNNMWNVYRQ